MTRQLPTLAVRWILASLLVLVGTSASAGLIGYQVTGTLNFGSTGGNFFDPNAYPFVPPGYLNAAGPTVTIGNPAVEFGFEDPANRDTADFTASQLIVADYVFMWAPNWTMTFTSVTPGLFTSISLVDQTFVPGLTYGLSGDVITIQWAGAGSRPDQLMTGFEATFDIGTADPIPEPGTLVLLGAGLVGLAARRRRRGL